MSTSTLGREERVRNAVTRLLKEKLVEAEKKVEELKENLVEAVHLDIEKGFFSASIYDIYDGLGHPCSSSMTARGLEGVIKGVEEEYLRKQGGGTIRTDGALKYSVYAELPKGGTIKLPLELWADLTVQPLESLKKGLST